MVFSSVALGERLFPPRRTVFHDARKSHMIPRPSFDCPSRLVASGCHVGKSTALGPLRASYWMVLNAVFMNHQSNCINLRETHVLFI